MHTTRTYSMPSLACSHVTCEMILVDRFDRIHSAPLVPASGLRGGYIQLQESSGIEYTGGFASEQQRFQDCNV